VSGCAGKFAMPRIVSYEQNEFGPDGDRLTWSKRSIIVIVIVPVVLVVVLVAVEAVAEVGVVVSGSSSNSNRVVV
jgi:hypothetical protein